LNFRYSPQYYNWVANSTNVLFSNISISGSSQSKNPAKNTVSKISARRLYRNVLLIGFISRMDGTLIAVTTSLSRTQ
jgi:hypothetical protein